MGLFCATASSSDSYQRSHGTGWSGAAVAPSLMVNPGLALLGLGTSF